MNSENQDGKTEPAYQATIWDFRVGKFSGEDQLRNVVIIFQDDHSTATAQRKFVIYKG